MYNQEKCNAMSILKFWEITVSGCYSCAAVVQFIICSYFINHHTWNSKPFDTSGSGKVKICNELEINAFLSQQSWLAVEAAGRKHGFQRFHDVQNDCLDDYQANEPNLQG